MRIVQVSTADVAGGASRSAYRLHDGLRRLGQSSQMYVLHKSSNDSTVHQYVPSRKKTTRLFRNARRLALNLAMRRYSNDSSAERTFFSDDRSPFYKDFCANIPECDLIHLHWAAGFIDYGAFFDWLPESVPLVWTLHDMANFTGGCSYDLGCNKFTIRCGSCPQLGSHNENDLTRQSWLRRQKCYSSSDSKRLHVVTPSRWLAEELGRSSLMSSMRRSRIPYGLDLEVFQPRDRKVAREVLGIPSGARVILFVSQDIHTPRKGFRLLTEALMGIEPSGKTFLLSLGMGARPEFKRFAHVHIPSVSDDGLLSLIYSAADIFVAPSLADNLPNTILESIACGTPVVAFDAGGMPDAVRPGITGLLAKAGNQEDLRAAIIQLLGNDSKRAEMSANCRRVALNEYALNIQAQQYLVLYEELLSQKNSR
jgi:glycosyltransferase involved in cell wall biosynthesis